MDVREIWVGDGVVPEAHKALARLRSAVGRTYGGFLEMPVALVLAVMWAAGAALLGSGALVLCLTAWARVRLATGAAQVGPVRVNRPLTFTVAEAAEHLGVPRREVREMIDSGRLRAIWLAGAARLTREEVERLERELPLCP